MDEFTDEKIKAYFDTIPDVVEDGFLRLGGWPAVIQEVCRRVGLPWEKVRAILFPDDPEEPIPPVQ